MAGLFFCLASTRCMAFIFARRRTSYIQAFTARFVQSMQSYTTQATKQRTGLYKGVSVNLTHSSAHNTAAAQAAYTPIAPRWRAYHQALHLHRYQIPPPRWTLHSLAQPPIIIRYIRVRRCAPVMDPRQAVQHNTDHASPAGSSPTVCGSLASSAPDAPAEGSTSPPAHGQPGGVSMLLTPGGLRSGTGSTVRAHKASLAPSTRRGSPAAGARRAARNH